MIATHPDEDLAKSARHGSPVARRAEAGQAMSALAQHVASEQNNAEHLSPAVSSPSPPPRSAPFPLLIAALYAVGLVVAIGTGAMILIQRDCTMTATKQEMSRLSLTLAIDAGRVFEAAAAVQNALVDHLKTSGMRTPDDFRRLMSGPDAHEDLRGRQPNLPQLDRISVIDADGNLINYSGPLPVPAVNVAEQDFFASLKADTHHPPFIDRPVQNRVTGMWTIALSQRVSGQQGEFIGVVVTTLRLSYFEPLARAVQTAPDTVISMMRRDGVMLAHYPRDDARMGRSYNLARPSMHGQELGPAGAFLQETSPIDGNERLISIHPLGTYPVGLSISQTMTSILHNWRQQAAFLLVLAAIIECVIVTVGIVTTRHMRGQRSLQEAQAELALAHERARAAHELELQNIRFSAALSNMSQALCLFDASGGLIVANTRLAEMFGLSPAQVTAGTTLGTLLAHAVDATPDVWADIAALRCAIEEFQIDNKAATAALDLTGGRALAISFVPIENAGWLVTLEDITERRQAEARIVHMAHHDSLTGLPNRVRFHEKLAQAVQRSRRGSHCAVLFLDLDHFKAVNDTLGHPIGDALLCHVTQRLRQETRQTDTVARLGGDEFAIVQTSSDQPLDATSLAIRLIDAISAPYEIDGHQVVIGTSVGIAMAPDDGDTADQLLKNADMALYRAKAEGRGRYQFFEPEMDARMQARRSLEIDLRKALATHEFELFYQPQMNLRSRSVVGFEALLRWNHPKRGLVSPSDFVPLAEEIGLIVPLGVWVLRQACADAATWPGAQKVAVNLSPMQFGSRTLVADVVAALRDSGLHPGRLELEITETVLLEDTEATLVILHRLRDLGVDIAMDDFGTGYSSLSYLRRFPFDKVKIDRSFIEDLGRGGDSDAIVSAVTGLCNRLGMTTVAEGVETEEQLRLLYAGTCTEVQGYLVSEPRPAHEVAALCNTLNDKGSRQSATAEWATDHVDQDLG